VNHLQLDSPRLAHRRLDKNKNPSDTIHSVSSPKILISRLTLTKNEEFQQIQPMDINWAEIVQPTTSPGPVKADLESPKGIFDIFDRVTSMKGSFAMKPPKPPGLKNHHTKVS